MSLASRGWAELPRYGKSLGQIRHQLSDSRNCTNLCSNLAVKNASGVRLGRILCLFWYEKIYLQLCGLRLFHLTPSGRRFEEIFEKYSAGQIPGNSRFHHNELFPSIFTYFLHNKV